MNEKDSLQSELINTLIGERRADRRWRIIRLFVWVFFILLFLFLMFMPQGGNSGDSSSKPYVSLIRLEGVIMPGTHFSAEEVIPHLNAAFCDKNSRGVVLVINSPGGSPVQASIIHDRINYLKTKYKKEVVVLGEDTLASGAYLVATAADKIYVNPDTLTGSIGVIMSGFGFTDAIQKLGITRRVFTAGKNKDRLDPFQPVSPEDQKKLKLVLDAVHQDFIQDVVIGRQGKLKGDSAQLFSGDFWTGTQAAQLGLVDGTANLWTLLSTEFKVEHYRDYSAPPSLMERILKGAETKFNLALENDHAHLQEVLN